MYMAKPSVYRKVQVFLNSTVHSRPDKTRNIRVHKKQVNLWLYNPKYIFLRIVSVYKEQNVVHVRTWYKCNQNLFELVYNKPH